VFCYLWSRESEVGGELEAEAEGLRVWVGEACHAYLSCEVSEVVEVLPPHHPHPDNPVPDLRRRHVRLLSAALMFRIRMFIGSNLDGIATWAVMFTHTLFDSPVG
jgi:hypothetical protein